MRARACPCAPVTQNSQPPNQKMRHQKAKAKKQAFFEDFSEDFFEAPLDDYLAPSPDGMDELLHFKTLEEIVEWLDEDGSFASPSR